MEYTKMTAEARAATGKGYARKIRHQGVIPAVVYGKGVDNQNVQVASRVVDDVLKSRLGKNTLIHLSVAGGKDYRVMIRDYQGNAITRALTHVDFVAIDENKDLHVFVPVKLTGKAEGILLGGQVEHITRQIDLICKPGKVPAEIVVDVTKLTLGHAIHLTDIKIPDGTRLPLGYNPTLVSMPVPRKEEEPAPVAAPAEGAAAAPTAGAAAAPGTAPSAAPGATPVAGAAPAAGAKDAKAGDKKAEGKAEKKR